MKILLREGNAIQLQNVEGPVVVLAHDLVGVADPRRVLLAVLHLDFYFLNIGILPFVGQSKFAKPCPGANVSEEFGSCGPVALG